MSFFFVALLEEHNGFSRDMGRTILQAISDQIIHGYLKGICYRDKQFKAYGLFSVFDATDVFMVDKDHFTQAGLGYSLLRAKVLDPLAKLFKIHRYKTPSFPGSHELGVYYL